MSKTKTPTIKTTSVPSAYDTPMTTLEYLRKVESQNAQVLARADEIEEALDGKVSKSGDTMTGDLSVSNINVNSNANVGKLISEKISQKYEGAIKSELHVDEQGIAEFVNAGNEGRFDTARVIKPSEVKTEIYDNQQGKRMFFRLPYLEASAGEHRLLTEEDLGGQGVNVYETNLTNTTSKGTVYTSIKVINEAFLFVRVNITPLSTGEGYEYNDNVFNVQASAELQAVLSNFFLQDDTHYELNIPLSCHALEYPSLIIFDCPAVLQYNRTNHDLKMRIGTNIRANIKATLNFSGTIIR